MAKKETKTDKAPAKKKTGRRPRFIASGSKSLNEVEQISKFMKASKQIDFSKPGSKEEFEIVCISTLGYTSNVVRELLLNFVKSTL
jgi:hypothetical protein